MQRLATSVVLMLTIALALPAAGHAYTLGLSDQQASTFANPLFPALKFRAARVVVPYDVMSVKQDRAALDAWLTGARTSNQRILISFEHSHRSASRARKLPSVTQFALALRKFHAAYPFVKEISPWNEVNRCQVATGDSVQGQPTCHNPRRVAQYYMAARNVFRGSTIVGIDLLDGRNINPTLAYLKTFLRYAKPRPRIIGLHNYSDTNRFSTLRTKRVLAAFSGQVWLTETGGIVKLGTALPYSPPRAARALGCMFSIARSNKRITRLYVYQFNPAPDPRTARFDAGLINPDGTRRPGYGIVQTRKARTCRL